MDKLVITVAITGSIHVPSQSPYLPITPGQIIEEAVRSCEAGASVAHIHVRDPITGKPSADQELFGQVLRGIKERSDIAVGATTGGAHGMTREQRLAVVSKYRPEMASFNMGSMNFALHTMAERVKEFKYDWEKDYLLSSKDNVFKNTFEDLEFGLAKMRECDVKPELEVYDVGQLYNAATLVSQGHLQLPVHMQFVMGVLGGIRPTLEDLIHLKHTADRLFGDQYTWSVIGAGLPAQFHMATHALLMGGNVRVGMEDNLRLERGKFAVSNAELVEKMVRIARDLGREIATPDEARQIIGLKGKDKVGY